MGKARKYNGLRFEILLRDKFTCQYCGRKPPEVVLQVDHIHPVARGGQNTHENLTTACRDCNSGKMTKVINGEVVPIPNAESLKERLKMKAEYARMIEADLQSREGDWVEFWTYYKQHFTEACIQDNFKTIIMNHLRTLTLDQLKSAVDITYRKFDRLSGRCSHVRYFSGICRSMSIEAEDACT